MEGGARQQPRTESFWCGGYRATTALAAESNEAHVPTICSAAVAAFRGKCFRQRQIHRQFNPTQHICMCGRKNSPPRPEPYSSVDVAGCSGETGIGGVIGVMIRGCWKALCPQGAVIQSRRKGAAAITASTISVA